MRAGKTSREVVAALEVSWNQGQNLCRKTRALGCKRSAPRPWAYKLAEFDPVVARAIETWRALV